MAIGIDDELVGIAARRRLAVEQNCGTTAKLGRGAEGPGPVAGYEVAACSRRQRVFLNSVASDRPSDESIKPGGVLPGSDCYCGRLLKPRCRALYCRSRAEWRSLGSFAVWKYRHTSATSELIPGRRCGLRRSAVFPSPKLPGACLASRKLSHPRRNQPVVREARPQLEQYEYHFDPRQCHAVAH